MLLRPLRPADLPGAVTALAADPGWERRAQHLLGTDPAGAWLAEDDGRVVGAALALRREGWWVLSSLDVVPGHDGRPDGRNDAQAVGRLLMERVLTHGAAALRGFICAAPASGAPALYRVFGHRLHPTMRMQGSVERTALPVIHSVRDGGVGDVDFADAVDRLVRGAAHGPDHRLLAQDHHLLVAESPTGRGYAWVGVEGPAVLAATDAVTARELLWEVLGRSGPGRSVAVERVTAEQDWAVDLAVRAGLGVSPDGFVCLRGMPRLPAPYLPSAWFG